MEKTIKHAIVVVLILTLCTSALVSITTAEHTTRNQFFDSNEHQPIDDILFNAKIRALLRAGQYPSASICLIKNDEIVWTKTYGYSKVWLRQKAHQNSIYLIGSTTKSITATALLQLYEQGKFDLDDDINTYLPFPLRNPKFPDVPITFRMLLSHSASIYDYCIYKVIGLLDVVKFLPFPETVDDWLANTLLPQGRFYRHQYWLDTPPGTTVTYSSIGYLVVGCLVEKLSGMKCADYCEHNIFQPLEMYNTSYEMQRLDRKNMVTPYIHRMGVYLPLPQYDPACFTLMGGVRSTSVDLSHFLIAQMNNGTYKGKRILTNDTIELMHQTIYKETIRNFSTLRRNRTYGLGWFSWDFFPFKTEGHCGMQPGAVAFMLTNKQDKTGFVFLSNQFDILGFFEPKIELKDRCMQKIGQLLFKKANEY